MPTSMSGKESSSETTESQMGKSREIFWTTASATDEATAPAMVQRMGNSVPSASFAESPLKVRAITFQLRTSAVIPPATMSPVAGHITHLSTSAKVIALAQPWAASGPGAITQARIDPSSTGSHPQPDGIPAPKETHPQLRPEAQRVAVRAEGDPPGKSFHGPSRRKQRRPEIPVPAARPGAGRPPPCAPGRGPPGSPPRCRRRR